MRALLAIADRIQRLLEAVADASGWLLIVLMCVTCVDVTFRKFGAPIPYTKLQELEWHLHTAIFALWLGFNYTINAHPRVDSYVADLALRKRAWIELAGCLLLALPYTAAVIWFGWDFVQQSYLVNERSEAAAGLPYRWIIKGVFYGGLLLLLAAILSVVIRLVAYLFGRVSPQEAGVRLGASRIEA